MSRLDLGIDGLTDFVAVGSGGFAVVYSATDKRFGREVAVKVLTNLDEAGHRRFEREQLSMGRMTGHASVVIPYSSGITSSGHPYLIMEYLSGGSLADLIEAAGPLGWVRAVETILPIADALGHGHTQGVLHRDVKPGNILLDDKGAAKLADFGIASIKRGTATEFQPFTLAHAPPETFGGGADRRDERSDLYSLASTLFEAATGQPPFHSAEPDDSYPAYLIRIMEYPVPTIGADPRYDRFLASALAKDPAERPQSAEEFVEALAATTEPQTTAKTTATSPDHTGDGQRPVSTTVASPAWSPPAVPLVPRAGWYAVDHGDGGGQERYWDGGQWRGASRPAEPSHRTPEPGGDPADPLGPPPGWYDDPAGDPELEQQWDGARWTGLSRPVATPAG